MVKVKMYCPYCGKQNEEMSAEHVIPRAIGGNLHPINPFKIKVCRECNSNCGTYIDGPFIKSWFVSNAKALSMSDHYDPSAEPILPMVYGGKLDPWIEEKTECEYWIGPIGESIYHIHKPYPTTGLYAGKPPNIRKNELNPGFVLSNCFTGDETYLRIYTKSIEATFEDAPFSLINVRGPDGSYPYPKLPISFEPYLDKIRKLNGEIHKVSIKIDLVAPNRFGVKLALGLGTALLGHEYIQSEYAQILRQALWEKKAENLRMHKVHGVHYFSKKNVFLSIFSWMEGHSLVLFPFRNKGLVASFYFFGSRPISVMISNEDRLFKGKFGEEGAIWLLSPTLRRFAGPIPVESYLAYKVNNSPEEAIEELEHRIKTSPKFPIPDLDEIP